jgi:hypothetical protein
VCREEFCTNEVLDAMREAVRVAFTVESSTLADREERIEEAAVTELIDDRATVVVFGVRRRQSGRTRSGHGARRGIHDELRQFRCGHVLRRRP